ncbi:acyl carrier protein phosphodiesterase [Pontibacter beigongshangensis]|uniref:acyl carrier protein phosphodiesterase n=1 Tax=Pontibacter beigongshangensis TaxID=2574733 RepID=UPI00165035C7|nr:ACP phosphodiesterase [Pontibacter beigongshangensis]
MNYLAHIYLSGDEEELLIGNFIADAVKGKQVEQYQEGIARGIRLHRLIDSYTDTHPVVRQTKLRLRPHFRKYAPVVADVFYDHFLAKGFEQYADVSLPAFAKQVYRIIENRFLLLPPKVQYFFPYMMRQDWLASYAEVEGIRRALVGMSRRTAFTSGMELAGDELEANYGRYGADFDTFFPDLVHYVEQVKKEL